MHSLENHFSSVKQRKRLLKQQQFVTYIKTMHVVKGHNSVGFGNTFEDGGGGGGAFE